MNTEYKKYEGELTAPKDANIAIIVARFNEMISSKLLSGALDALNRIEFDQNNISVFWVPGSFEIGITAKNLVDKNEYDGILCLGAVIRGGTPHFEYIASESAKAIANLGLQTGLPIINSIITAENLEQAIERAGAKMGNKGYDGALTLIEMINLIRKI